MKYKLVVFDLDGTILDTLEDLTDSVNYAASLSGYPARSQEEVRSFVGNGIRRLIERALPEGTDEARVDEVHQNFTRYYKAHCADKTKPYEGIVELLGRLRENGCRTAVVSNKADYAVQELCQQYFEGLFDAAVGERKGIARKPAPDSLLATLDCLQTEISEAVYIGDSEVDIKTAQNAGMSCISVSWGFRSRELLREQGADVIVENVEQLWLALQ